MEMADPNMGLVRRFDMGALIAAEFAAGKPAIAPGKLAWTSLLRDAIFHTYSGNWHRTMALAKTPTGAVVLDTITEGSLATARTAQARPAALSDLTAHGYSDEEISALVVPKRTLARRRAGNQLLTIEETDKALRLKRVAVMAERVFGDPAKAQRWLRKPKDRLDGDTPLDWLASESGARVVEEMLHQIEHGIFA